MIFRVLSLELSAKCLVCGIVCELGAHAKFQKPRTERKKDAVNSCHYVLKGRRAAHELRSNKNIPELYSY